MGFSSAYSLLSFINFSELNYKNGKTDGLYESYFKNGQLSSRGKFKNGSMVGKWKFYNDGGTLNRVEEY